MTSGRLTQCKFVALLKTGKYIEIVLCAVFRRLESNFRNNFCTLTYIVPNQRTNVGIAYSFIRLIFCRLCVETRIDAVRVCVKCVLKCVHTQIHCSFRKNQTII